MTLPGTGSWPCCQALNLGWPVSLTCPKCSTRHDTSRLKPGEVFFCQCGHALSAPKPFRPLPWLVGLLVLLSCGGLGWFTYVAVRNFILFGARAKQGECKGYLRALYKAQEEFKRKHGTYAGTIGPLGVPIERGNRYAYAIAAQGPLEDRSQSKIPSIPEAVGVEKDLFKYGAPAITLRNFPATFAGGMRLGIVGQCSDYCALTMACVGNIDQDPDLDLWSISSVARRDKNGKIIPPGEPLHDMDDLKYE